jgi:hypothetical protein
MSKDDQLRYGAPAENAVHICVDMQRMFAEGTDWKMPWLSRVLPNIAAITASHPDRTIFTRFIPARKPGEGSGMWQHYYKRWGSMTIQELGAKRHIGPLRHTDQGGTLTRRHHCLETHPYRAPRSAHRLRPRLSHIQGSSQLRCSLLLTILPLRLYSMTLPRRLIIGWEPYGDAQFRGDEADRPIRDDHLRGVV